MMVGALIFSQKNTLKRRFSVDIKVNLCDNIITENINKIH